MKRTIALFFGFLVGISYIILPLDKYVFEGFTGLLSALLEVLGLLIVLVLGTVLVVDALRCIRYNSKK